MGRLLFYRCCTCFHPFCFSPEPSLWHYFVGEGIMFKRDGGFRVLCLLLPAIVMLSTCFPPPRVHLQHIQYILYPPLQNPALHVYWVTESPLPKAVLNMEVLLNLCYLVNETYFTSFAGAHLSSIAKPLRELNALTLNLNAV